MDGHFFLDKEGPYKTMNDLWDGKRSILHVHVHECMCEGCCRVLYWSRLSRIPCTMQT